MEKSPSLIKISIKNISKKFLMPSGSSVEALREINLDIFDGEFVCIIGASGCGKTTLLRIIGDFEDASSGSVDISSDSSDRNLLTSTVFQEDSVFPWMNVEDNVGYGLKIKNIQKSEWQETVNYFIDKIGLQSFKKAFPSHLSGGMRQRVSVARAFANNPEILLMDEPFGALDEQTRLVMQDELLRLWSSHKRAVVFVTHNLDEAITLADRVIVLSARPGRVKEIIPIDIPRPRNVVSLRQNKRYGEIYQHLWNLLRDDINHKVVI